MAAKTISPQAGFQYRFARSNANVILGGGVLNPQPLTSHILTPDGFVAFSDLKKGDVVCGLNGTTQTVTHCDYEGEKDCIRITLEDGSSAESALDHKWWILKDGQEMTAISFELLESFQVASENGRSYDVSIFRYLDGKAVPFRVTSIDDIGKKEVACVGVTNEDQLYITDDYLITKNCGKAQPITSKVLTPTGWRYIGDLKIGDKICDTEGGEQEVLRIYEKGFRTVYDVYFEGGMTRCCEEHLWEVYDYYYNTVETMTLRRLATRETPCAIMCPKPVLVRPKDESPFIIKPYSFGRLLGKCNVNDINISDNMRAKLAVIGIRDEMFIPDRYMDAEVKDRKDLLRGLIDETTNNLPDGVANVFRVSVTHCLARDLKELVLSLGGILYLRRKTAQRSIVDIVMPIPEEYMSEYKADASLYEPNMISRSFLGINNPQKERCRCILVSNPNHLYITDDYIVTHNTFGAILSVAEPTLDPKFRGAFTRRNLGNLKQGGGIVDDFETAYDDYIKVTTSENPRISFPSGAYIDCLHIADENPAKLMERAKGWQYDYFYMDELTSYEFSTFRIIGTRCRGKASWTGHVAGTTNPKRSHWTRKVLDWYIGPDGFIMPERDGIVRYCYQLGEDIDGFIMGDTKEEVYELCKPDIDKKLKKLAGKGWTYKDMIRSFVFYAGKMSENKASIGNNAGYIGAVAGVGGRRSQQLIEGNFNVDEDEDDQAPISSRDAQAVFDNDPCTNGDEWITVDLADVGTDNVVALHWNGFHVDDMMTISNSTPRVNYERIHLFAEKHRIPESHIIFDATHGAYMNDYMPEAIGFISASSSIGIYALSADRLKDECYLRLCNVIASGRLSFSPKVARSRYLHQNLKNEQTVQAEFLEECSVVRFNETPRGKKKLMTKKEMNARLGKNRSMDLLDPCAMRMLPVLRYHYGEELDMTASGHARTMEREEGTFDIYSDSNWC